MVAPNHVCTNMLLYFLRIGYTWLPPNTLHISKKHIDAHVDVTAKRLQTCIYKLHSITSVNNKIGQETC